jgi:putative transposase
MVDLKLVYDVTTPDDAESRLEEFREKWGKKYPQIIKS